MALILSAIAISRIVGLTLNEKFSKYPMEIC
jgi:hypothetical protein